MSAVENRETGVQRDGARAGLAAGKIPVENPATGEIIAHVDDLDTAQVEAIAQHARRAQPAWAALGFEERAQVMYELRYWIIQNRERLIRTVIAENGKTREDAMLAELWYVCDSLGFWAK